MTLRLRKAWITSDDNERLRLVTSSLPIFEQFLDRHTFTSYRAKGKETLGQLEPPDTPQKASLTDRTDPKPRLKPCLSAGLFPTFRRILYDRLEKQVPPSSCSIYA